MKYEPYGIIEANDIIVNTRSIASNPYKLFVAQVLNAVYDYMTDEDDSETVCSIQNIWYSTIPTVDFKNIMEDCLNDFRGAVKNRLRIDIADQSYTLRNISNLNMELMKQSFDFKLKEGDYVISPDGIVNISKPIVTPDMIAANRSFAMAVWYQGNTSDDGWQDLTEMEVAVYFWLRYIRRNNGVPDIPNVFKVWFDKYHKSFFVGFDDIESCLQDGKVKTAFSFSAEKVGDFNKMNKERSYLCDVDIDEAADYWYKTLNL